MPSPYDALLQAAQPQAGGSPYDALIAAVNSPSKDPGSISEPQYPGLWNKVKGTVRNVFEPTSEGGPANAAQVVTAPIRMLAHSGDPAESVMEVAASKMGEKGVNPYIAAAVGTAGAIAGDPLTYMPTSKGVKPFFAPGAMMETASELAPLIKAGGAKVANLVGSLKPAAKAAETLSPDMIAMAQKAEQAGVPFTPSALKPGDVAEKAYMGKPELNDITQKFRTSQDQALNQHLEDTAGKHFGPDTLAKTPGQRGEQIKQTIEDFKAKRNAEYGQAEDAIMNQVPAGKTPNQVKPIGLEPSNQVYDFLEKSGVPSDENGFALDKMTGRERITKPEAQNLLDMAGRMRGAETVGDLLAAKRNFIAEHSLSYSTLPDRGEALTQKAVGFANDAIQDALKNVPKSAQPAAQRWLEVNKTYAQTQGPLRDAYNIMDKKSPEDIYQSLILNKGSKAVEQLKPILGEKFSLVQQAALEDMVNKAQASADPSKALKTYWTKTLDPDLKSALFTPAQRQAIQDHLDIRNFTQGPQSVMGTQRVGGSQTAALGSIAKTIKESPAKVIGTTVGAALGHIPGSIAGNLAGGLVDKGIANRLSAKAGEFFSQKPGFYMPPAAAKAAPLPFKVTPAMVEKVAQMGLLTQENKPNNTVKFPSQEVKQMLLRQLGAR